MLSKLKKISSEYPLSFKILTLTTFIDRLGGFLLGPFFAVYVTKQFGVGMTEVGMLIMFQSLGSTLGTTLGGALSDKFGRRTIMLFGLVVSGLGSIAMGLAHSLFAFYIISIILGVLGSLGFPARQAMITDILPPDKRADGFGILRIAVNISATIGPILGGFLALRSFMALFVADAISSLITGIIVLITIPETIPEKTEEQSNESFFQTFKGYREVLKDGIFLAYLAISAGMILVYMQLYSTLSVFLSNERAYTPNMLGWLISLNAFLVVLFQFMITRKVSKRSPFIMLALGTLFYGIGFTMFGIVESLFFNFLAVGIITIGEMIVMPVGNSLAAKFAPEDKRGRYMAAFGFAWMIPNMFGGIVAGQVMDNYNPNWVWFGTGIISAIVIIGFGILHKLSKDRFTEEEITPAIRIKRQKSPKIKVND